jgi:hypothetical protein
MAGASMDVQKRIYLNGYTADDLRGLEEVVSIESVNQVMKDKIQSDMGKTRGN